MVELEGYMITMENGHAAFMTWTDDMRLGKTKCGTTGNRARLKWKIGYEW